MEFIKDIYKQKRDSLKEVFVKKEFTIKGYTLKFMKAENAWYVLKGHSIIYIGEETACRTYLNGL